LGGAGVFAQAKEKSKLKYQKLKRQFFMFDLIIIGAGPAGMTAGIYAARAKLETLVIAGEFGGWIARENVEIENYPGFEKIPGKELIGRFKSHLESFGVRTKMAEVFELKKKDGIFEVSAGEEKFSAKALIVATGASPRPAGIPGEQDFLGKGVCYCATCDGPLFAKKDVAVIGGGNAAFDAARFLAKFAGKIYVLEKGKEVSADGAGREALEQTGKARIIANARITKIGGDNFVKGITYYDAGDPEKKEIILPVAGIFVKAGNSPAAEFLGSLVDLDEKSQIKIDPGTNRTKTEGLFAAGDVTDAKYKQVVIAAGQGAAAALSADAYLRQIR